MILAVYFSIIALAVMSFILSLSKAKGFIPFSLTSFTSTLIVVLILAFEISSVYYRSKVTATVKAKGR